MQLQSARGRCSVLKAPGLCLGCVSQSAEELLDRVLALELHLMRGDRRELLVVEDDAAATRALIDGREEARGDILVK